MQSVAEVHHHQLPEYTRPFTAGITDNFRCFLYEHLKKTQALEKKMSDLIKSHVTINLKAIDGFLRKIDIKLSRLTPCSG